MNLFRKVVNSIDYKKERLSQGKVNAIPFGFPAFGKYVPGIVPETQIGLTTVSGGGKTAVTTSMFVQTPFDFWLDNRDKLDFDIKIFLYCLEDSPEMTLKRFLINALWTQLQIRVDMYTLECYYDNRQVSDDVRRAIEKLDPYFDLFLSKVEILDAKNPTGIYKPVEKWLRLPENGSIVDIHNNILTPQEEKAAHESFTKTYYKPKNDNRFVIVAVDNLNNVSPEKGADSKWLACDRLCREYMREKLCGFYKTTNFIVCQQSAETEDSEYSADGDTIKDKFMPSLGKIAEYRNVTHTCHLMLGLFSPYRYKMEHFSPMGSNYPYDITRLQDFYRNMYILKGNFVGANISTSLLFDGVTGTISELPSAGNERMKEVYSYCEKMIRNSSDIKPLKIN